MLTKKKVKEYLASPTHCPYCNSDMIQADHLEWQDDFATQVVRCDSCGKKWQDVLAVVDIIEEDEE